MSSNQAKRADSVVMAPFQTRFTCRFNVSIATLLSALAVVCVPSPATACTHDPVFMKSLPGSSTGFIHTSLDPRAPVHLPANARGMLYRSEQPPQVNYFTLADQASGQILPVRITPIHALERAAKLPLTIHIGENQRTLYRIDPVDGFRPGRHYRLESKSKYDFVDVVTHIQVDHEAFDPRQHGVALRQVEAVNREAMNVGMCSQYYVQAATWRTDFTLPAPLKPYSPLLLALTIDHQANAVLDRREVESGPGDAAFNEQRDFFGVKPGYFRALDDWPEEIKAVGDNPAEALISFIFKPSPRNAVTTMWGLVGMLEVEDALYATASVAIRTGGAGLPALDSLDFLRQAERGRDRAHLLEVVMTLPVRDTDRIMPPEKEKVWFSDVDAKAPVHRRIYARQRRLDLVNALQRILRDPSPALRSAASLALPRVLIAGKADVRMTGSAAEALLVNMRDSYQPVRRDATAAMVMLLEHVRGNDQFCGRDDARRWAGQCFDLARLAPLVTADACEPKYESCKIPVSPAAAPYK